MTAQPVATPAGVAFPAYGGNSAYLSRTDHRPGAAGNRNKWDTSCSPTCEYGVFTDAETHGWRDSRPQLWGLLPGLAILGLERRRLAKFPDPQNPQDTWHGYPVSALDTQREFEHRPEGALVDAWVAAGVIDVVQGARIKRGKV